MLAKSDVFIKFCYEFVNVIAKGYNIKRFLEAIYKEINLALILIDSYLNIDFS